MRCHRIDVKLILNILLYDLSFVKNIKFKSATALHNPYQAKKRKRNQREDPVRCQEEEKQTVAAMQKFSLHNPEILQKQGNRDKKKKQKLITKLDRVIQKGAKTNNYTTQ